MSIRQQITEQLIEAIEAGCPPWQQGWSVPLIHRNISTQNAYSGINNLILTLAVSKSGNCADNRWATFKQAKAEGYSIRRGAKAAHICRMVEVDKRSANAGEEIIAEDPKRMLVMKTYAVFNGSDIEGLPPLETPTLGKEPTAAVEAILAGLRAAGMVYLEGGSAAFYSPQMDTLKMPYRGAFKDAVSHAATLLHECGHASGHAKRLDRFGKATDQNAEAERAREEIRVEMASAFLCSELGIDLGQAEILNHGAYLASWLAAIKHAKTHNEVFKAAADAQKIADYLKTFALNATAEIEDACEEVPVQPVQVMAAQTAPGRRRGMRL